MPDTWLRITATSPSADTVSPLAEGLLASGGSAVEENGRELTTYLPLTGDPGLLAMRVQTTLSAMAGEAVEVHWAVVPEEDWLAVWRSGLAARRIGERIVVAPTWVDPMARPGDVVIRIDPQMAFGTGEHASTRGVLRLVQQALRPGERVLDVGTGSAILAIAAAMLGARQVTAVESDVEAIGNARDNVDLNGVADRVSVMHARVDDAFLANAGAGAYDGILANVLSGVLVPLLPAFRSVLAPAGWAILAGILAEESATVRARAAEAGFAVEAEDAEEQWWGVLLRRCDGKGG